MCVAVIEPVSQTASVAPSGSLWVEHQGFLGFEAGALDCGMVLFNHNPRSSRAFSITTFPKHRAPTYKGFSTPAPNQTDRHLYMPCTDTVS